MCMYSKDNFPFKVVKELQHFQVYNLRRRFKLMSSKFILTAPEVMVEPTLSVGLGNVKWTDGAGKARLDFGSRIELVLKPALTLR